MFAGLSLGVGLILAGLVFVLLVWLLLKLSSRAPLEGRTALQSFPPPESQSSESVLIIEPGGRVEFINAPARQAFGMADDEAPDLERLMRRVRPAEEFLDLCIAPGQKRFSVNGRLMEASSYQVPGPYPLMLVSLRGLDLAPLLEGGEGAPNAVLKVVADFTQSIFASLEFNDTLLAIFQNVGRLVAADRMEIKVWDAAAQAFVPYRFEGESGLPRVVKSARAQFSGFTDSLASGRQALFLPDVKSAPGSEEIERSGLAAYLGIPLQVGSELVGTLEIGQTTHATLGERDLELVTLLAGQAAVAIRNARLFEAEQKRIGELRGLSNLAQSSASIQDSKELFTRLVDSIAPLFNVEIVGFLLYDETEHALEGLMPFKGLPPNVVNIYRTVIKPGSPADRLLVKRELILMTDAARDLTMHELGLHDLAMLASLREAAFVPLLSGERLLGYLQLANHRGGTSAFTADELHLARTVADQAAAAIENAVLVQDSRLNSRRSEALDRIARLVISPAPLDVVLQSSVQELAALLQVDAAAVFLLDDEHPGLRLAPSSIWGLSPEQAKPLQRIEFHEDDFLGSVSSTRQPFLSGRLTVDERVNSLYIRNFGALGMESIVVLPLVARDRNVGEFMFASRQADFFKASDLQVLTTAGGLIAAAVEGASLLHQTDESLRRRVDQLMAVTRVTRELNSTLDLDRLLEVIHTESLRTTRAGCGTLLLLDPASGPQDPRVVYSLGCNENPLSPLTRQVLATGQPLLVADTGTWQYPPPHEGVGSALVVPVTQQGKTVGLLHLHAEQPNFFDQIALETAQTLAAQAALALANARRYQEERQRAENLRRRAETLARFTDTHYSINFEQPLEQSLQAIAEGIQEATQFQVVLFSVYEPETGLLRRVAGVGLPPDTLNDLLSRKQPLQSVQQLLKAEFKVSRSYFIPADQTPVIPADVHSVVVGSKTENAPNAWDPDDFMLTLLEDAAGNPLGLLSVDAPRDGMRPDRASIEALEAFAAQASLTISNFYRLNDLNSRIESLSSGLQRQQRLLSVTQNDLPVLLRKDLEQTISIQNLDQRGQRIRAGLAITESVSRQLDASSALQALGREVLTQLGMTVALVAEETPDGPHLLHVLGGVPKATNVEALFGQRNPLRACLASGEPILVANIDESDEWRDVPLLTGLRAKGFICLPIAIEGRPMAAMLAVTPEPMPALTDEDRQVYYQIARQTSVVLQNIALLNETRRRLQEVNLLLDFSRQLSSVDPNAVVKSLLDSARRVLPAAHAGTVLVWNPQELRLLPRAVSGYADNAGMMQISYAPGEALPGIVFASGRPRRVDEVNFTRDYPLEAENLNRYRQATGGRLPVSSLLIPILAGEQGLGVLVLDNFNTPAAFTQEDETLLVSLSQQVALSLENVRLVQATQERAGQLQALTDVAATITSSLKSSELVAGLLDQLSPVLPYDTATLWLREKDRLYVSAARGFPDTEQRLGLSVDVADSALFKEMIRTSQAIAVGDVRHDPRFPPLEAPRLSWMGIPLLAKGELIGLIALERWQANSFTNESVQVATTFASQAAVALENARLFEESVSRAAELDQRSQRLALLNRFSSALSGLLDEGQIQELTANELFSALGALRVSVVAFERGQPVIKAILPVPKRAAPKSVPNAPIFDRLRESGGVFSAEDVRAEPELAPLLDFLGSQTRGLLILPLGAPPEPRALVFVHGGGDSRFGLTEIELARTIGNQASIALENARLYQSTVRTAEQFSILNRASSQISASLDPEEIYKAVHSAAKRLMPVESFVIALLDKERQDIEGAYLMDGDTRSPVQRLPLGKGLSGKVIKTGEPLLLHNAEQADDLGAVPYGDVRAPLSILAVPMTLGGETVGMLSAQSYQSNVYTVEDQQILSTLANQAIVAIQNARLFAETQRLAEELERRVVERTAQLQREQQNTETLLRILTEVSSSLDLDRALNRTLALLNEAIGAEQGTIMLLHAEDNLLHYRAGYGYLTAKATAESRSVTLKVGEGLAGWVVENRQSALIDDLRKDPRWVRNAQSSRDHRSAIVTPLLVGEDVIGVLMAFHREEAYFSAELLNLVKAIAGQVAVAINNAHLYELIRDQAERLGTMLRKEQEEASRSQAILEAVADGVLVTGVDNRISFLNSSAERILKLQADRVLHQPLETFGGLFGKAAGTWMETISRWSDQPAAYQAGDTYAEQIELEDNRIILVHLAPVMLHNEFLGTVSIFRDITHEVEVDRLKSEFVATVSHELRTPMTSIRGYADILLMGAAGALNENQAHFLHIIRNNTERLNILVNDLLDISRIEAGRVTLSPQPLDLREVAEDVIADILRRSQEENKPMALSLEAPRDLPRVYGDTERVRQILDNLVDNAYHYTPENGQILVRIHTPNGGEEVQVDVKDNGVGISPEDQPRVFERFYRGEHPLVLATPGTGLGLPIVKQLIEMHQGRIWMDSKGIPGEGSTFSFTLPIYESGKGKNGKNTDR